MSDRSATVVIFLIFAAYMAYGWWASSQAIDHYLGA